MKTVIFTGSREWRRADVVLEALRRCDEKGVQYYSVGDCKTGVDAIVRRYLVSRGVVPIEWVADWDRYRGGAGPRRNQQMVDAGADLCIGFAEPGVRGTIDCLERASIAGIQCCAYLLPEARWYSWACDALPCRVLAKRGRTK